MGTFLPAASKFKRIINKLERLFPDEDLLESLRHSDMQKLQNLRRPTACLFPLRNVN
jgi:hypothetical protein